jgi:hypothetical protein
MHTALKNLDPPGLSALGHEGGDYGTAITPASALQEAAGSV